MLTACGGGKADDWQALREEANELYNGQQYQEALEKYDKALSKALGNDKLTLRQDIIDCYQALGNQTKARELLKAQLTETHAAGNIQMEAEAMLTLGMQIYDTGDKQTGYDYMTQAVSLMEKSDAADAPYLLAYYHYVLMKRRALDQDYAQALIDSKAVEANLQKSGQPENGEQMLIRTLATRACLYLETDSAAKADSTYALWQQHQPIAVCSERDICPYLTRRGRYQEVVDIQRRYVEWVREKKGLWTASERTSKYEMAEAEAALGNGVEAYRLLKESYEINDTLLARQAEANAQELEAVYQNQLKAEQISRLRLWVIILGGIAAVLAVMLLAYRIKTVRKRKNKALIDVARSLAQPATSIEMSELDTMTDDAQTRDSETVRFATFDRTVEQGRLYTQSDLSREMLSDLMGVDRTTFSRIIQEQSGCKNMNDYLNQKRIRHAARLLREQPNYTIQAVMEDSGFQSKSNFIRLFRDTYGMTPSEYRKGSE
ncbi:MAG: AraC family transcriptional regulator [Bacteroidaceae bacterium]|nr:AraC family transcriptional regulator [Bacteroidaceae bacterium]